MKTRRSNYSPGDITKNKIKTNAKAVKRLSNSKSTKANCKTPMRKAVVVIEKENYDSPSRRKATKVRKSQTNVEVTVKRNYSLKSKPKGKRSETSEVAEVKRKTSLRKAKMLKEDTEIMEENRVTLRKRRGQPPKTFAKPKKTVPKPQNIGKRKKLKDVEVIERKNFNPSKKLKRKMSEPKDNMEEEREENIKDTDDTVEILEDDVEFLEEDSINTREDNDNESPRESNIEMQEVSKDVNNENVVSDDDDDCPDEVAFGSSKEEAMENLKLIKNEIDKIRNERKEMRKRIHDRNILQKKQKKDKVAEIQKRKLSPELLEYISKLPKTATDFETKQTKPEELKSMDTDEDEKCEESVPSKEFISLYGSTEFRPLHLETMIKKPPSLADTIAKFKQQAFFGNKNKRESVWELKSKTIKQAVAGKL